MNAGNVAVHTEVHALHITMRRNTSKIKCLKKNLDALNVVHSPMFMSAIIVALSFVLIATLMRCALIMMTTHTVISTAQIVVRIDKGDTDTVIPCNPKAIHNNPCIS
jgi:ascorbate-specific PTS system EIIC-type component UlaA